MILLTCRHRPGQPDHIYPGESGTQIRDDVVDLAGARNKNKCRPFSVAIKRVNGHSAKMTEKLATHSPRFHSSTSCRCPLHLEFMQSGGHLDNRRRLNTNVTVFIAIRTSQHTAEWIEAFRKATRDIPEIVDVYRMSGEVDYLVRAFVPDIEAYDALYKKLIARVALNDVTSMFAMEELKSTTEVPLNYA